MCDQGARARASDDASLAEASATESGVDNALRSLDDSARERRERGGSHCVSVPGVFEG